MRRRKNLKKKAKDKELGYVYLIRCIDYLKIGFTRDLSQRVVTYEQHNPYAYLVERIRFATPENEIALLGYVRDLDPYDTWYKEWFCFKNNIEKVIDTIVWWMYQIEEGNALYLNFDKDLRKMQDHYREIIANLVKQSPEEWDKIAKYISYGLRQASLYYKYANKKWLANRLKSLEEKISFELMSIEEFVNKNYKPVKNSLSKTVVLDEVLYLKILFVLKHLLGSKYMYVIPRIIGFIESEFCTDFFPFLAGDEKFLKELNSEDEDKKKG